MARAAVSARPVLLGSKVTLPIAAEIDGGTALHGEAGNRMDLIAV
jgi:hypothetical protein